MKGSRRKSLDDFPCMGVLLKVMGGRAERAQSKMKEKEKSTSGLEKVTPLILQTGPKRLCSRKESCCLSLLGREPSSAQSEEQSMLLAAEGL